QTTSPYPLFPLHFLWGIADDFGRCIATPLSRHSITLLPDVYTHLDRDIQNPAGPPLVPP
ncbi:MAG: hypothetical protein AAFW75_13325, partial [Cyanobacteria bacterium J06636_16]